MCLVDDHRGTQRVPESVRLPHSRNTLPIDIQKHNTPPKKSDRKRKTHRRATLQTSCAVETTTSNATYDDDKEVLVVLIVVTPSPAAAPCPRKCGMQSATSCSMFWMVDGLVSLAFVQGRAQSKTTQPQPIPDPATPLPPAPATQTGFCCPLGCHHPHSNTARGANPERSRQTRGPPLLRGRHILYVYILGVDGWG